MSKIGISWWGLCAEFNNHRYINIDTPDGHRYGRPALINALKSAGHEIYALQQRREPVPFPDVKYVMETDDHFPDLDVIFLEHRWPTQKNDVTDSNFVANKYEPDLDRQREIIEHYHGKIPLITWDTDFKITREFEERYPELILTDPSFETNSITRKRTSLPFWTDWKKLFDVREPYPVYGYVGNNYERSDQFEKYYFSVKQDMRLMGVQVSMHGNWLQKSPDRQSPASLISQHREVAFCDRKNFFDSMAAINSFITTTHVSKQSYYSKGFISPRYIEALMCSCPALIPAEQKYSDIFGQKWVAQNPSDVIAKVRQLKDVSLNVRKEIVDEQIAKMKDFAKFDVMSVVKFIESVI